MVYVLLWGCIMVAAGLNGCPTKGTAPVNPSSVYIGSVLAQLDYTDTHIDEIIGAAEETAERLIGGGRIFITDDESLVLSGEDRERISAGGVAYTIHDNSGGFVAEACDRAGGLGTIKPLTGNEQVNDRDVVLVGTLDLHSVEQASQLAALRESGALIIVFGSRSAQVASAADHVIDNGLGAGTVPVIHISEESVIGPVAGLANVINMWTFTAELVAALTRQGKMPTLWQSMFVPGAEVRNARIGKSQFESDVQVPPVKPGVLGRKYVSTVRGYLENIRTTELTQFKKAGALCAETIASGSRVVTWLIGHFMTSQNRMPEFPDIFTILEHDNISELLRETLRSDDVLLHVGYSYYPEADLLFARERGSKTICIMTPGPTISGEGEPVEPDMSLFDVYINPYWKHGDAVVDVPGYDTRIIPPSGVVMVTCYWMIIGETMVHLTRQ